MKPIRLLITDDSVVSRQMLKNCLSSVPGFEVVAVATNGRMALDKIPLYAPDLVILDIEMPEMNGLETLKAIREQHGWLPVIMFSAMTEAGAEITVRALAGGANDYVTKPSTQGLKPDEVQDYILDHFVPRIKALCQKSNLDPVKVKPSVPPSPAKLSLSVILQRVDVLGIGVSTGGPNALAEVFPALPAHFPVPILLVQHMPPMFTRYLAERLDDISQIKVVEAQDGMVLQAGWAYVAPGGSHMDLQKSDGKTAIVLTQAPPENSCRPAVDVTFRAMVSCFGASSLGVIMTGMGQDGFKGAEAIYAAGGKLLAQDEESSTVWGMPSYLAKAGLADKVLPLNELAAEMIKRVMWGR